MSQLTFATQPGVADLADATFDQDKPVTDVALQQLNQNAKFAALRPETFYGWYKNGETVQLPVSLVDRYAYSRSELEYEVAAWCSRSPASGAATNGAATKPARANLNDGPGALFLMDFWVEEKNEADPGRVHCLVSYWSNGTETVTNGGYVKVRTIATRLSA
jgi:hypothetical protein